jgi:hypothetical protein
MPISELGYRSWDGRRLGRLWRWLAISRTHVGIALRSSKLLRRFLFLAWTPLLYFGPLFFAVGWVADPANDLTQGGLLTEIAREAFFGPGVLDQLRVSPGTLLPAVWAVAFFFFFTLTQTFCTMVVVAIVAPPLIARDVRSRAFLLYLSKPIGAGEYLLGKLGVVVFFVFAITLFPALVLYGISISLCPDLGTAFATAAILGRIVVASLVMAIPVAMIALLMSSLTGNHRIATFGWIAICLIGEIAYHSIVFGGAIGSAGRNLDWAPFLSLRETAITATSAVFDLSGYARDLVAELRAGGADVEALVGSVANQLGRGSHLHSALTGAVGSGDAPDGLSPWVSVAFLATVTLVAGAVVLRRVTKPVRI